MNDRKQEYAHAMAQLGAEAFNTLRDFVKSSYDRITDTDIDVCRLCGYTKTTEMHHASCPVGKAEAILTVKDGLIAANEVLQSVEPERIALVCNQDDCHESATYQYTWVTGRQMLACDKHAWAAKEIAEVMGFLLFLSPLAEDGKIKRDVHWVGLDEIE